MIRLIARNTEIAVSFWFFAVIALFAAACPAAIAPYLAIPVIIHELGHFIAIIICKIKIKAVRFTAFGVEIQKSGRYGTAAETAVSLAGAAANLILAAALYICAFKSMRSMLLISSNIAVAAFNLLPVGSLDGGEAAKTLAEYFFKPRLAYNLSRAFSFLSLAPLFAAAIFLLMRPERNFTLLLVCAYLLIDIMRNS